jgi:hypothetical protein
VDPVAEQMRLPGSYGAPSHVLTWTEVEPRLSQAPTYWLATTRRDGRAHAVPVDGIWQDGGLYFGGDPGTVHIRNLRADPRAVVHTESGASPVIVEGAAEWYTPNEHEAGGLATATQEKYGYPTSPQWFTTGTWRLLPRVALAWNVLFEDATRFTFR